MNHYMQIDVPHSEYGEGTYFIGDVLQRWLRERGLKWAYCGCSSWGDGYTNGVTNRESTYMIRDMEREDGLAFKIMFPKCRVYITSYE